MDKDEEKKSEGRFADAVKVALDKLETPNEWRNFGPVLESKVQDVLAIMWKTYRNEYELHFFDLMPHATELRGHAELAKVIFANGKCSRLDCVTTKFGKSLAQQLLARKHIAKSPVVLSMKMKEQSRLSSLATIKRKREKNKSGKEVSE